MSPDEQLKSGARRLILGTAQFGMPYGVTNRFGQISLKDGRDIVELAFGLGISLVDSASSYGSSESVLGQYLSEFPDMGVITKTIAIPSSTITLEDIENVRKGVAWSLERLQRDHLEGLLIHHAGDLQKPGGESLVELLLQCKSQGFIRKIGISVYDEKEIDDALDLFKPDIVQLPLNIFDQRLVRTGHIEALRAAGIEIHARSTFLQGVLLAQKAALPVYFQKFSDNFLRYEAFLKENRLSPLRACLGFMVQQSGVDRVIVGVTSKAELNEIVAMLPDSALPPMDTLASSSLELIDPRMWTKANEISKQ